jgi:hypothetical protein
MAKKTKTAKRVEPKLDQDAIDRAFIQQFKALVRSVPLGPNTVLLYLLCEALDRLRV